MSFTTRDIQARLWALGQNPGSIDGMMGPKTRAAAKEALRYRDGNTMLDLFHHSGLHRVHWHWTAGAYGAIALELRAYNAVVDEHGNVHDGLFRPEAQARYQPGKAASHTLNANTGAIGISVDAMAGAKDRPFHWGSAPMTQAQIDGMIDQTALWCAAYDIPCSPFSTLSHAEVQETLGIRQKWKWDIRVLPGMDDIADARAIGDRLRAMLAERLEDYGVPKWEMAA